MPRACINAGILQALDDFFDPVKTRRIVKAFIADNRLDFLQDLIALHLHQVSEGGRETGKSRLSRSLLQDMP